MNWTINRSNFGASDLVRRNTRAKLKKVNTARTWPAYVTRRALAERFDHTYLSPIPDVAISPIPKEPIHSRYQSAFRSRVVRNTKKFNTPTARRTPKNMPSIVSVGLVTRDTASRVINDTARS